MGQSQLLSEKQHHLIKLMKQKYINSRIIYFYIIFINKNKIDVFLTLQWP